MRHWSYPCLIALGLLHPRLCLAQTVTDEARQEREMQEDVEVLRRIATESVQELYQKAEERVLRNCASCHTVQTPFDLIFDAAKNPCRFTLPMGDARDPHLHSPRGNEMKSTSEAEVTSLANYVPGQGIILQLESPTPVVDGDVKAWVAAEEAVPKRWDVLLRETRGEPEKKSALDPLVLAHQRRGVHRLILTEKVVEMLAENGRNLRHVMPEERVTVAFTFRSPSREKREMERATLLRHYFPNASGQLSGNPNTVANAAANALANVSAKPRQDSDSGSSPLTQAVAGDLLLRQEKYLEAVAAYEKALAAAGVNPAERIWDAATGEQRKPPLAAPAAEIVRKLIQAHVGAKNFSKATSLLQWLERSQASSDDELQALRRIYLDLVGVPPTPDEVKAYLADTRANRRELLVDRLLAQSREDERALRVPARMIISCTRKQLDDVATGKLSKLDFSGKVTLKYYKALPAEKKDAPAKK
jgi:hypothetical protein